MRCALALLGALFVSLPAGCHRGSGSGPSQSTDGPQPGPRVTESPAVSEAEARTLLDAWLAAQNRGDFAAYSKLYAARMDGIKRAGPRIRRFDRAGWLGDRARMFEPPASGSPMRVEVAETTIQVGPTTARVRFTQTFSRGTFQDQGPKELFLARQDGALRIAREEMLSSDETTSREAPSDLAAAERGFFFLIDQGVVLSRDPGRGAARGRPELLPQEAGDDTYLARSAVDERLVDESARRWKGRQLQLFDETGPTCVATVGKLSLLVRVDPHFSDTQRWSGLVDKRGDRLENGKPTSGAAITKEVWEMAEPILVGALVGGCKASWARDPALPAPAMATVAEEPSGAARTAAEKQLRRHPAVASDPHASADEDAKISFTRVTGKGARSPLLVARFESGDGCADFIGLTFIWEVSGDPSRPRLKLLNKPALGPLTIESAFDLDGDGRLELLGTMGGIGVSEIQLLHPSNGYGDAEVLGLSMLDCYC